MPLLRINGKNILFIHVPKTGGSAIAEYYRKYTTFSLERFQIGHWDKPCIPRHYHGALLERMISPDLIDVAFMVVRDPVERFVSDYKFYVKRKRREERLPNFSAWLSYRLWRAARNQFYMDNHFRPQVEFECFGADVFRYEDGLEHCIRKVNEAVGLDCSAVLPHVNVSPDLSVIPSASDRRKIFRFYAADFKKYEYDTPS